MATEKQICIIGAGGCGREALCCLMDMLALDTNQIANKVVFMVGDEHFKDETILGVHVIKRSEFNYKEYDLVVAIGDPSLRKKVVEKLPSDANFLTLIHPSVIKSPFLKIGQGSIVTAGCILTCDIEIGEHSHINLNTTLTHDLKAGNYFTTAPGVNVSGNCHFGDCVYLGTNAAVKQGISICDNVTIGMGAIVVKNITEPGVYIGNPAKIMSRLN